MNLAFSYSKIMWRWWAGSWAQGGCCRCLCRGWIAWVNRKKAKYNHHQQQNTISTGTRKPLRISPFHGRKNTAFAVFPLITSTKYHNLRIAPCLDMVFWLNEKTWSLNDFIIVSGGATHWETKDKISFIFFFFFRKTLFFTSKQESGPKVFEWDGISEHFPRSCFRCWGSVLREGRDAVQRLWGLRSWVQCGQHVSYVLGTLETSPVGRRDGCSQVVVQCRVGTRNLMVTWIIMWNGGCPGKGMDSHSVSLIYEPAGPQAGLWRHDEDVAATSHPLRGRRMKEDMKCTTSIQRQETLTSPAELWVSASSSSPLDTLCISNEKNTQAGASLPVNFNNLISSSMELLTCSSLWDFNLINICKPFENSE